MIPYVKTGEPLKADAQNELLKAVNQLLWDAERRRDTITAIALFELTADPVIPTGSGSTMSSEPTIYATAKRVWWKLNSGSDAYNSYKTQSGDQEPKVWFPSAIRDSNGWGKYCGHGSGDLVWAHFSRQSDRWEVIEPKPSVVFAWATTTAAVSSADSTFTVDATVPFDGSTWSGDNPLTVSNSPDGFAIDADITGKIVYCKNPTGTEWAWHPFDFACPANCECDVE
jgi:hypothetical protein